MAGWPSGAGAGAGFFPLLVCHHPPPFLFVPCPFQYRCCHRDLFLQQLPIRAHGRFRHKVPNEFLVGEGVADGDEAHPQVMGHPALHRRPLSGRRAALWGEVHRLEQAVASGGTQAAQLFQVAHHRSWHQGQGEPGGVGGDDPVGLHLPFHGQRWDAVGFVPIVVAPVQDSVGGLGHPPGDAPCCPPIHLGADGETEGLVEQRPHRCWQEELGHEVFKHGARPGHHPAVLPPPHQAPVQARPVLHRHVPSGHRHIAGQTGFAGHQVVASWRKCLLFAVVADIEQLPLVVVQGTERHGIGQRLGLFRQLWIALLPQPLGQGDEAGAQVAAVHGGDEDRRQGLGGLDVIPVIEMPPPLGQFFDAVQHMPQQRRHLFLLCQSQLPGRQAAEQRHADVGGGRPVGRLVGGELLDVVRREVVMLRRQLFRKVAPDVLRLVEQKALVSRPDGGTLGHGTV